MTKSVSLHLHTMYSTRDGIAKVAGIVQYAKAKGFSAVGITDHGTLAGIENAVRILNPDGINIIPGVEAYIADETTGRRAHLCLYAKTYSGYERISQAVTKSASNISGGFPCMTISMLKEVFAGHDDVFATSACMNGVLAQVLRSDEHITADIEKAKARQSKYSSPDSPLYVRACAERDKAYSAWQTANTEYKAAQRLAKKPYTMRISSVAKQKRDPDYDVLKRALDADMAASEQAKASLDTLKRLDTQLKSAYTDANRICKDAEKEHERYRECQATIDELNAKKSSPDVLVAKTKALMMELNSIFGHGNFFVELQYHGIDTEKEVMPILAKLASENGIMVCAANDAHTISGSDDELRARQIVRTLRYDKPEPITPDTRELYMKTDEELYTALTHILPASTAERAIRGAHYIADHCNVEWPKMQYHHPKFPCDDATALLRSECMKGKERIFHNPAKWNQVYADRLDMELKVIEECGFSDYLLIVADFMRYGRALGKVDFNNPPKAYLDDPYNVEALEKAVGQRVGVGVGPGRGSAVGSLACYLLGITALDPIKYGLLFERFLNKERVSMPDIDSDFRPDIRDKVLDYVKHKYGSEAVCCIMTQGTFGGKSALRSAARVLALENPEQDTEYRVLGDALARIFDDKMPICSDSFPGYQENGMAQRIIKDASLIEGVISNIGVHAAGVIIADNGNVSKYVPLMYASGKGELTAQADKNVAEDVLGLLKMDFLGLINLDTINRTINAVNRMLGFTIDIERLQMEPKVFENIFATGNTNTVFQFESAGMKEMLRRFKPSNLNDIILLVAAYRPGPMQYLDKIIKTKHGELEKDYVIPEMARILDQTYGYPVYQEQVMQIFHEFAGFSLGESDIIRRYMAKKKPEKFVVYEDKFISGLVAHGASPDRAKKFWDELVAFSEYAFNKSHAAVYAYLAYCTAWLKYHYALQYYCAALNVSASEKYAQLIADARMVGVRVRTPDINKADVDFIIDGKEIIFGLGNIKGIASAAAPIVAERNNKPFADILDFMVRTQAKSNTLEALIKAGAFDKMYPGRRTSLLTAIKEYATYLKALREKRELIASLNPNDAKDAKRIATAQQRIAEIEDAINAVTRNMSTTTDNAMNVLLKEKELLGAFISRHPLDSYEVNRYIQIADAPTGDATLAGIITGLRLSARKSDKSTIAFFTLEDKSGSIEVCVFADAYARNADVIAENAVVSIKGRVVADDGDDEQVKLLASKITVLNQKQQNIVLFVDDVTEWEHVRANILPAYLDPQGAPLKVYLRCDRKFIQPMLTVNNAIVSDARVNAKF